jgi:hypothetical protein
MKNLMFIPILLLIFIVPSTAYAHIYTEIFSDDFNRGESNSVGNGWDPYYAKADGAIGSIEGDVLFLDGNESTSQRPCVWHQFDIPPSTENLQVNYTYNFVPLPHEVDVDDTNGFQVSMRLGENMDCTPPVTDRAVELFHAGSAEKPSVLVNGTFGHFHSGNARALEGIVNGLVDVSIIATLDENNINSHFSYTVTGDVVDIVDGTPIDIEIENVPFINQVAVNSIYIKLDKIQTAATIDDFTLNTFPDVVGTCGIIPIDNFYYGIVKPGETSDYAEIEIITTGDTDSIVSVSAADWTRENSGITQIPVENTRFSTDETLPYDFMTTLTDTLKEIGVLSHHYSYTTYWKTQVPIDITHKGELFQTMTFDAKCN